MSWEHREWSRPDARGILARLDRRWLPPPATSVVLGLFLAGMIALTVAGAQKSEWVVLRADTARATAILLHAFAANGAFQALLMVVSIAALGSVVEHRVGPLRTAALAFAGPAFAGLAFFSVGRLVPPLATYPLVAPFGALAALGVCAWHVADFESVAFFGAPVGLRRMLLIVAAVLVALALFAAGPGALAWLAALAAGGACAPLLLIALSAGRRTPRRARSKPIARSRREPPALDVPEIDEILAKISRSGLGSLSEAEREQLDVARRTLQARSGDRERDSRR